MKLFEKIQKWYYFHIANPVVRRGESGGFRWEFRRFWLTIETVSGNWKARWTAAEHPYAYLLVGKDDDNIIGFAQIAYQVGMLLTTDQGFANDIAKAITKYQKRLEKKAAGEVKEDEIEEKVALEEVKAVQEHVEKSPKERKKAEKETDRKFRKAVKEAAKNENQS